MKPASLCCFLLAAIWIYPDTAHALFEAEATFGSFYGRDWGTTLWWGAVGLVVTTALAAAVFFTGGAASPVVAPGATALGTLIGNFMGLSGAAATKAGLALVGGGAISAGGLGMAGGAAIITAVSGIALDSAILAGETIYASRRDERETGALYVRLVRSSEGLITFPLPTRSSGSDALKDAMSALGDVDTELPLAVGTNRLLMSKAITKLRWSSEERDNALAALVHIDGVDAEFFGRNQKSVKEAVDILLQSAQVADMRDAAMLSLLYFILNDYTKASHHAERAVEIAQAEDPEGFAPRITLPMFISATSSLYDQDADSEIAISRLEESLLREPKNKLVPLLFSIFLDRITLRSMADGQLNVEVFHRVFDIMRAPALAEFRVTNYILLLGRYLIHIENERLKIRSLAGASDDTIRNHPKTLPYVTDALDTYRLLLRGASDVESNIVVLSSEGLNDGQKQAVAALRGEYTRAILEREELSALVNKLERQEAKE